MNADDVFINCPFSSDYDSHFKAIVFTVIRSGFNPRCTREDADDGHVRYDKICKIIAECKFGVHDISYTGLYGDPQQDPDFPLPRFNMPLELGLFLGAKRFDKTQSEKRLLIFDRDEFRFQKFISDLSGQDIHFHQNDIKQLIVKLAAWLRAATRRTTVPGGEAIANEHGDFVAELPSILENLALDIGEVSYHDFVWLAKEWISQRQA
jgi:hypothetical protein